MTGSDREIPEHCHIPILSIQLSALLWNPLIICDP